VSPPASEGGLPPVVHRIRTTDKVVFLTIDDGWTKDAALPALLKAWGVPVTVFATNDAIKDDLPYLRTLRAAGATVQNHTLTHADLRKGSRSSAEREICGASDAYARDFGERPWLFRPPFGSYDDATVQAAKACGIGYVVLWDVSQPGRWLRYADGSALRPGDIVLLHFVPHLSEYLAHTLRVIKAAGLTVGRLEDYLPRTAA
jgi:peptidoglycan/xylan/chitin deacetylase (PgdA/CDA1 family)